MALVFVSFPYCVPPIRPAAKNLARKAKVDDERQLSATWSRIDTDLNNLVKIGFYFQYGENKPEALPLIGPDES